jgi:hypothetical protein
MQETQRFAGVFHILTACLFVLALGFSAHAAPTPVITASYGTSGMAPYAIHVHALNTGFTAGDRLTALFEWDFGDNGSAYNKLNGFNAAHVYENPGSYLVRLSVTDQNGDKVTTTLTVNVAPDTRSAIYVAANGNDGNPGTQNSPIRTVARASQLMGNNKKFLFRRGDTFDLSNDLYINHSNVLVGAYGSGNAPVFRWTSGSGGYPALIQMHDQSHAVVIQDLNLTSVHAPSHSAPRGIHPEGDNITIRRCAFSNVSDAMNAEGYVFGWLVQQNTSAVTGGYFIWNHGSDHTILNNVNTGSLNEHTVRMGNSQRVYIGHNDFTNTIKSNIWFMLGSDGYVARNTLRQGRVLVGPNFAFSSNSERFQRAVIEGNHIEDTNIILYSGAEHVMIRNNVIESGALESVSVWGWLPAYSRTVDDVRILNNTGINTSNLYGKFVKLGDGAEHVSAINNLYVAPNLNTAYAGANAYSDETTLATHYFNKNLWSSPDNGNAVHFFDSSGLSMAQWDALSQVGSEQYRSFNSSDLNSNFAPQNFNANVGIHATGVHTDFYDACRPSGGVCTVGAVELNPGNCGGTPPPPPPPPPSGDMIVFNMQDGTGWNVQSTAITGGAWERGNPAGDGTRGDPTDDHDGSGACWLTGNQAGNSDVDGGPTRLASPTINMSQGGNIIVNYALWMHNANDNDGDHIRVEVSNNNGQTWHYVHSVSETSGWDVYSFRVSDFIGATSQMKLRFIVSDNPNNSVTEAGVDDLRICLNGGCASPNVTPGNGGGGDGDVDGDGDVNVDDLIAVMMSWGVCGVCPADLTHDGAVNVDDMLQVLLHWD